MAKGKSNEPVASNATKNIIGAMQQHVKRLIVAVSSRYSDPKDKFQFGFDFGVLMLKIIGRSIRNEIVETGEQVVNSLLDHGTPARVK